MKSKYLAILLLGATLLLDLFWALTAWPALLTSSEIVPIFGQPQGVTYVLLWFILPFIGGIIAVVVFPRIIAPLFLLFKNVNTRKFENAYLEPEPQPISSIFLRRYVYSYLLLLGFMTLAVKFIPSELLLSEFASENLPLIGQDPQTHVVFLTAAGGLLSAAVVGLWSVGWSMEDAGLIHFSMASDDAGGLRELEPIHVRYNSYVKGYAGISSILFVVGMAFSLFAEGRLLDIVGILSMPLHLMLMLTPAILLHSKLNPNWLRKNTPQGKNNMLQRADLVEEKL